MRQRCTREASRAQDAAKRSKPKQALESRPDTRRGEQDARQERIKADKRAGMGPEYPGPIARLAKRAAKIQAKDQGRQASKGWAPSILGPPYNAG